MNSQEFQNKELKTAVLFLVFNRPDTTRQVFEAIRRAKPPRLYVAADGPREGKFGEVERVEEVRTIATAVDWPCEVKTVFRDKNLGCYKAVSTAITWFFENEEQGIILEDDCLPSQSFFWFCEEILDRYCEDELIMAVTGTNITKQLTFEADYFFSKYALMWGWASWRRAWTKYDPKLTHWPTLKKRRWLKSLNLGGLIFEYIWKNAFDRTIQLVEEDVCTSWDYQWIYTCWLNNGLTVAPGKNLIQNIGFSDDATHTRVQDSILSNLKLNDLQWPLKKPLNFTPNLEADAFIGKHWFKVDLKFFIKSFIFRLPGVKKVYEVRKNFIKKNKKN
jgi:hypothetical protein